MMDEFENNRENEHVDQTPHAETPYEIGRASCRERV